MVFINRDWRRCCRAIEISVVTFSNVVRSDSRTSSAWAIRSFDAGAGGKEEEVTGIVPAPEVEGRRFAGPELPLDVVMRGSFEEDGWERLVVRRSDNALRAEVDAAGEAMR